MSQLVHLQHAADDVKSYIEQATAIVGELEIADDLKVPGFVKAIELLAGTHLVVEPQPAGMLGAPELPLR